MTYLIGQPLTLPVSGITLKNRLAKAATTECLADPATNLPNERHSRLYASWAEGGVGLCITGNVQVDRRYMEAPRNVAIEDERNFALFQDWAKHCKTGGCVSIVQLGHAGRQAPISVTWSPVSASDVPVRIAGAPKIFAKPRPLTGEEINNVVERFATAARVCAEAGFDGVEVHSAHGYLLSQFLSPLSNKRTDQWGGPLESRQRLLITVVKAIREAIGKNKALIVKLNSADFLRGGFSADDSINVIQALEETKMVDMIEISGGTYEKSAMAGDLEEKRESTKQREVYFLEFAKNVRQKTTLPLMVTGGFRSRDVMESVLKSGDLDVIGMARPICVDPQFPNKLLSGKVDTAAKYDLAFGPKSLSKIILPLLFNYWHQRQIHRTSEGLPTDLKLGKLYCLTVQFFFGMVWDPFANPQRSACNAAASVFLLGLTAMFFKDDSNIQ